MWEDPCIDLDWYNARKEAFDTKLEELLDEGMDETEARAEADSYVDDEWSELNQDFNGETHLYGDWKLVNDKFEPDYYGQLGYSAIYNNNENIIQVVWSRWAIKCRRCSPCYPGQGDVDTPGDDYMAYTLPLDCMQEDWQKEHGHRVAEIA